ncbi:multiheme c-type cytochrome [Thioalkalicoccus limnaeus]|uniref:Multiheme c-type cytochrome n=1 Tax=Thioalkalicoccus limnaeus TaxID=120681 RepID=A0ABV4BKY0_9GAMM
MSRPILWMVAAPFLYWCSAAPAGTGDAAVGEDLANRYCIACHGPGGSGSGPVPPLAGMPAEALVRTMQLIRSGDRESATMGQLSATMTDQQFVDLGAYFSNLDPVVDALEAQRLHHVSARVCQWCHEDVYEQWSGSMHARSTALSDPIHELMYRQEVGDPRAENQVHQRAQTYPVCLQCHAPNAAQDGVTKLDAMAAYAEGVNCVACHRISGYKGVRREGGGLRLGLLAYETSSVLQGPKGYPFDQVRTPDSPHTGNPHIDKLDAFGQRVSASLPLEASPRILRTSELCLGCHHLRPNPQGVPLCATGDEFEASGAQVTCQSCHMPVVNGIAHHGMGGGHDNAMLARAVLLTVDLEPTLDGVRAHVVLQNKLPHKMPTGAPFRNVQIQVTALDDKGRILWQNYQQHAQKEAPEAYLFYQLADDQGQPAMPPEATQVGIDTRLDPHERRTISYDLPFRPAFVRAEMFYNLVFEGMKPRVLELTDDEELLQPRRMAFYETRYRP